MGRAETYCSYPKVISAFAPYADESIATHLLGLCHGCLVQGYRKPYTRIGILNRHALEDKSHRASRRQTPQEMVPACFTPPTRVHKTSASLTRHWCNFCILSIRCEGRAAYVVVRNGNIIIDASVSSFLGSIADTQIARIPLLTELPNS